MTQRRKTIGLVVDQIASLVDQDFFQNIIISGVADIARKRDINLIVFVVGKLFSPYEWEKSRNLLIEFIRESQVDGLIVLSTSIAGYVDKHAIGKVLQGFDDIPLVSIGETYETHPSVISSCYQAMREMVEHLIVVHDKRQLAFIKGPEGGHESEIRYAAYRDALSAHGIPFDPNMVFTGNYLYDSGAAAIRHFRRKNLAFDALVASNDNMALGAISELRRIYGLLPGDLSIVGFDDAVFASPLGLTTVRQNFRKQAQVATEILCNLMEGNNQEVHHELASELIIRSSCGCVPKVISNVFRDPTSRSTDKLATGSGRRFREDAKALRKTALHILEQTAKRVGIDTAEKELLPRMQRKLAETLAESIMTRSKRPFYHTLDQFLNYLRDHDRPLTELQNMLSELRKAVLGQFRNTDTFPFAEDLFHAARVHIGDALSKHEATHYFLSSLQTAQLEQFSEELFSALHYQEQMQRTEELLTKYGIRFGFIALYEDSDNPLDKARLILKVMNGKWVEMGEGITFPTRDLLPAEVKLELKAHRVDLVVQVLFHGDTQLGYSLFSFDDKVTRYYEVINNRLSIALKSARHIMEAQNYSQNLELQVAERTKELTATNAKLLEEVHKRQEAEDKLRIALEDLAALNEELRAISIRDELTGLLNRRGFMEKGRAHIRELIERGQAYLIMFADMDDLKGINDRYGHGEGDIAIARTANLLRAALPPTSVLSRLGGDEFTAIIPLPPDMHQNGARVMQERILAKFAEYNRTCNKHYELCISLGFASGTPDGTEDFEELMKRADNRLYEQKREKRHA